MPDRPGSYAQINRSQSMHDESSQEPSMPGGKWGSFILWLLPVVFAAGSTVAVIRYLATEVDRLEARVEQLANTLGERDRRLQQLEVQASQSERDREASIVYRTDLQSRLSKVERNMLVVCTTQRSLTCER